MTKALEGIRIVWLNSIGPGPHCTMLLNDLGAEVIVLEEPARGGRRAQETQAGFSPAYDPWLRDKRRMGLNLKAEAGKKILYDLIKTADVFLEGTRPGVPAKLGIDYDTLSNINPRLIYCSISAFGQDGPYRDMAAHDINILALAGVLSQIGTKGGAPAIPSNFVVDYGAAGMYAVMGILAALLARERTGVGQFVDVSMLDTTVSLTAVAFAGYFQTKQLPVIGNGPLTGEYPHYNVYETSDGKYLSVGPIEPWLFANLCKAIGREDLAPMQYNPAKADEIFATLRQTFKTKTRDEWWEYLRPFDCCVAPVLDMEEAASFPQTLARKMIVELEDPKEGKVRQVGVPVKLSATPGKLGNSKATTGQHTNEILSSLGYSASDIEALKEQGVV